MVQKLGLEYAQRTDEKELMRLILIVLISSGSEVTAVSIQLMHALAKVRRTFLRAPVNDSVTSAMSVSRITS